MGVGVGNGRGAEFAWCDGYSAPVRWLPRVRSRNSLARATATKSQRQERTLRKLCNDLALSPR